MVWFSILKTLLNLVLSVSSIIREKQLLDAGAKQEISKQLAKIILENKVVSETRDTISRMTEDEIDNALRGDDN